MEKITFGPNADPTAVSTYTLGVLKDIMCAAGVTSVVISSTARDAFNQARVMYANFVANGAQHQLHLYAAAGDAVINVAVAMKGKPATEVITAMKKKIEETGPAKVSRHCADPKVLCVLDVAPSSIPKAKHAAFERAVKLEARVTKFFLPPADPGFHLEIPQPKK